MAEYPDERLHERFVEGDPLALEELYRRYERQAHGWILRIVRDPAAGPGGCPSVCTVRCSSCY